MTGRKRILALVGLFAASLALNLYQWWSGTTPAAQPTATRPRSSLQGAQRSERPPPVPDARGDRTLPPTCPGQLAQVAERLSRTEQALEEYRPWPDRFERGSAAPSLERDLAAELKPLFDDLPEGWSQNLECRADICRLEITEREGGVDFDWQERLQGENRPKKQQGVRFEAGVPMQDPVSKDPLVSHVMYMRMASPGSESGAAILRDVLSRFRASGAVGRCEAAHPAEGYWTVRLDLEPEPRRIDLQAGGTLVVEAVGSCLRAELERIIAATEIPESFTDAVIFDTIALPST